MAYDIQHAVPNTIRVKTSGNITALEFLNAVAGYRYRINPSGTSALSTSGPDSEWNIFGQFSSDILAGAALGTAIAINVNRHSKNIRH